jgi:hypothetical protein
VFRNAGAFIYKFMTREVEVHQVLLRVRVPSQSRHNFLEVVLISFNLPAALYPRFVI